MATAEAPIGALPQGEASQELARSWRRLTRSATIVAVLTSPALYIFLKQQNGWNWWETALATFGILVVFRGFVDLLFHRMIPWPSLFGLESQRLREEDVVSHRRAWFWRFWFKIAVLFIVIVTTIWIFQGGTWWGAAGSIFSGLGNILSSPQLWLQVVFVFFLFIANFGILFGPLLAMNLSQVRGFEPGDAEWGVKLEDVRGQLEAKEEVRRVVSIWQSGEQFERAGGKRERGLLFFGPPGTGKTMLAKAIATGFNSPFVSIPGSGFAATFIGIDAIVVRYVAWKAKRMARKWGGQCIVFIDEIDAVGMRRQALGGGDVGGATTAAPLMSLDPDADLFFGPWGARNPSGDVIRETQAWQDRLFEARAPQSIGINGFQASMMRLYNFMFPGGMGGGMGGMALNQLLVVMDGIDNPPFMRRVITNRTNTLLDAIYIVPRRVKNRSLRMPAPRPRKEQIYFIGATNVPIDRLDPALIRPGRMGRHVWFRTPTKQDRLDILDLYIGKVAHDAALDTPKKRDEIARITGGYSPAMIEQVTSMALTKAHHSGREEFVWEDLVESLTTLESGSAVGIEKVQKELYSVAVHEAGHAIAGHVYLPDHESTRLSVRMRGNSHGHHQARSKDERFIRFQSEQFADIVWGLGAMAAERVFFGENTQGVGGDVYSATYDAAQMVGGWAMGPEPFEVTPLEGETEEQARQRVLERFEAIGLQIMNRMGGGPMAQDPVSSALSDPTKRRSGAQILGQAYVAAHNLATHNRQAIEWVAQAVADKKEIFGDDLVSLLEAQQITIPTVDYNDEASWPAPFFSASRPQRPAIEAPTNGRPVT